MDYSKFVAQMTATNTHQQVCVDMFKKLVEASCGLTIPVSLTYTAANSVVAQEIGFAGNKMRKNLNAHVSKEAPPNAINPVEDADYDEFEKIYFFECSNGKSGKAMEVKFFLGHSRCTYTEITA